MCSSRKNPYPPHGRSLEIPRGRGVLKAKFLEAMYENKLEFPGGRGAAQQKPSVGGVGIFSGTAQLDFMSCNSGVIMLAFLIILALCTQSIYNCLIIP